MFVVTAVILFGIPSKYRLVRAASHPICVVGGNESEQPLSGHAGGPGRRE